MTAARLFSISVCVFVAATCGLAGFFFLGFKYFTYRGTGLDWIYSAGGLCTFAMLVGGLVALASGVVAISQRLGIGERVQR